MRLVAAALVTAALALSPAAAQPVPALAAGETLLTIEATGEHRARPDVMTITASTVTAGTTAPAAVAANAVIATRLIEAVRASGIEARDVRTTGLSVSPRFNDVERERAQQEARAPRILGYVVENQFELRFRDLARASDIIGALFAAGANRVNGPTFTLADPAPARRLAERDAIRQGMAEAANYAAAMGKRVGRVLRVSERRGYGNDPVSDEIMVTGSRIARTPIEPGELATKADIFLDVALVD